jgi:DNA-binding transcriptional ArsR family regulator
MVVAANLVEVAALVGDTARATILAALMGGQALTASELAYIARVSRPTASEHLTKLAEARLIAVTKQGRYRYYRIASPLVARMLESIIAVAAIDVPPRYQPRSIRDDALRFARTCYDHLAGQVGVGGRKVPDRIRRRLAYTGQARVLPALPRLERAPASPRRPSRRGNLAPLSRARLVQARA